MGVAGCLPVQAAPLRVDRIQRTGEVTTDGDQWAAVVVVSVTDAAGAQTDVRVRAGAMWDETAGSWVLTQLDCLATGGE